MASIENDKQHILDMLNQTIQDEKLVLVKLKEQLFCNSSKITRCDIARNPEVLTLDETQNSYISNHETIIDNMLENKDRIIDSLNIRDQSFKGFDDSKFRMDEKYELKDVATKFIYEHVLTQNAIISLLFTIQKMWYVSIKKYIKIFNEENGTRIKKDDIKLLYRGGNTLSSILENLLATSPPLLSKQIRDTFSNVMAKSDVDFTIMINPMNELTDDIYKKLFDELSILTLAITFRLRYLILTNHLNIFNIINELTLKKLLDNLNLMECIKDIPENMSPYKGFKFVRIVHNGVYYESQNLDDVPLNHKIDKYNLGVFSDNIKGSGHDDIQILNYNGKSIIQKLQLILTYTDYPTDNLSDLYITYNNDNKYKSEHLLQRYSLARLKMNFRAYYIHKGKLSVIHLPGELIDLGLTNNNVIDENSVVYENTKADLLEKWNNIQLYKFNDKSGINNVDLHSFTLKYYFIDICNMLFQIFKYPWENKKYTKMLNRVFLLCMIDLLSHTKEDGVISPGTTHILSFIKNISGGKTIDKKIAYVKSINSKLFYHALFDNIKSLIDEVATNGDEHAKSELFKFNDNKNTILRMSEGIIQSSFSQHTAKFIVNSLETHVLL